MAFWAKSFVFDNIPSETYDLFIISDGASGVLTNVGSGSVTLFTKEIYRRQKPFFFGTQQSPTLQFDLTFGSLNPIEANKQMLIQPWLLGQSKYKKLQICQDDYGDVYFNCIMTSPEIVTIGNFAYSFKCTVICDSPFAWEFPKTYTVNNIATTTTFNFNNISNNNDYMYPTLKFYLSATSTGFTLVNTTLNETFSMSNLSNNEVITINCDLGIITSSLGLSRYSKLSGGFFRLKPLINNISIGTNLTKFEMIYQNARRVSA